MMAAGLISNGQPLVALITGASSGFGLLTAIALARQGYQVVATMRDPGKAGELLELAQKEQVADAVIPMRLDVTDRESISQAVEEVMARFGRIDLLVNNAGLAVGGYIEELSLEDWRQQMETNFFGVVAMTKAVLPQMRERRSGCIINVGSVSGRVGFPGYGPYAASKFAVEGYSESLRHEMSPYGVRVVLVEPGAFRTAIWHKGLARIVSHESSPYRERLESVLRYSRLAGQQAPDPGQVANLIARIAAKRSPRLRYPVGQGAKAMLWGKEHLPWKWLEWVVAQALKLK